MNGPARRAAGGPVAALLLLALLAALWPTPARGGAGRVITVVSHDPASPWGPSARVVALTFDDGPNATWTPLILGTLRRYRARATFFLLGRQATSYPQLTRRIVAQGHAVGGHTMDHLDLRTLDGGQFHQQVDRANALISRLSGTRVTCVRPPYGALNSSVAQRLSARGLSTAMWSIDPRDWARPGATAIINATLRQLRPGGIVVLHDGGGDRSQTVAALPRIIAGIRARGYRIVPICATRRSS